MIFWALTAFCFLLATLDLSFLLILTQGFGAFWVVLSQGIGAALGLWLLKRKDLHLLFFLAIEVGKGERIVPELWEDGLVLVGCFGLLAPGFLSDLLGVLILLPSTRPQVLGVFHHLYQRFLVD